MAAVVGVSAGDFIAAINLTKEVIAALRDSGGSSKEFQDVISELRALLIILHDVKDLELDVEQRRERAALRAQSALCQDIIYAFLDQIKKYYPCLRHGGSSSSWKDGLRRVQWALCEKKELVAFRMALTSHIQTIELQILTLQM